MNDAFELQGELSPSPSFDSLPSQRDTTGQGPAFQEPVERLVDESPVPDLEEPAAAQPNGFEKMGLAPELLQAVRDLGFTVTSQDEVAPTYTRTIAAVGG